MTKTLDKILQYIKNNKARFHMPGHNGLDFAQINNAFDVTELPGLDNLLSSSDCILESEKFIAQSYGKNFSLLLTQGSTTAMQISIVFSIFQGYKIAAIGSMHTSFYNTIRVQNASYDSFESIEEFNEKNKTSHEKYAIYITSPDYFGCVKKTDDIYKKNKDILIVDSAHGAHFPFSTLLPSLDMPNVDILFVSLHKTMPAKTGASCMFAKSEEIYLALKYFRSMIHSTSPSYLVLASIDYAVDDFQKNGENYYKKIFNEVNKYNGDFGKFKQVKSDDISRLVLQAKGYDAYDVLEQLHEKGIDIEMAYLDKIVLILTPYNIDKLDLFYKELQNVILKQLTIKEINHTAKEGLKKADKCAIEFVDLNDAKGRVSASEISIYPPSIPIVFYNEIIDEESLEVLKANKDHLSGLVNNKVPVLK